MIRPQDRKLAELMARDTGRYERRGINLATRLGAQVRGKVLSGYRRHRRLDLHGFKMTFLKATRELRDAMVCSYLAGLWRVKRQATLALSTYGDAIKLLQGRLEVSPADLREIEKKCEIQALLAITKATDYAEEKLQTAILQAVQEGAHVKGGVELLREAFEASGITPVNSFQLEAIFRTQMRVAYGAAQYQAEQDPAVDDILWGYLWLTVKDDRVRENHALMEGTTARKDHEIWTRWAAPAGWCCRCSRVELFSPRPEYIPHPEAQPDEGFGPRLLKALATKIPLAA